MLLEEFLDIANEQENQEDGEVRFDDERMV